MEELQTLERKENTPLRLLESGEVTELNGGQSQALNLKSKQHGVVEARRSTVEELMIRGWSQTRIAEKVGVHVSQINRDHKRILERWRQTQLEDISIRATQDLLRIDFAIDKLWPQVELGVVKAIDALAKLIGLRSDILGYKQGVTIDIEQYTREVAMAHGFDPERALELAQKITVTMR